MPAMDKRAEIESLQMLVEQWEGASITRIVSASCNVLVARGAFNSAVETIALRPGGRLTLRHGARIIAQHPEVPYRDPDVAGANAEYERMKALRPKGRVRKFK